MLRSIKWMESNQEQRICKHITKKSSKNLILSPHQEEPFNFLLAPLEPKNQLPCLPQPGALRPAAQLYSGSAFLFCVWTTGGLPYFCLCCLIATTYFLVSSFHLLFSSFDFFFILQVFLIVCVIVICLKQRRYTEA